MPGPCRSILGLTVTTIVAFVVMACALSCQAAGLPPHAIVVYHDSWDESRPPARRARRWRSLPAFISVVNLAFAKPDLSYSGHLDLAQTGLEYRYSGQVLRDSIDQLKLRNPGTRVLLSVGGAAYHNWLGFNEAAVVALVHDLHADGVDLDFEPRRPGCMAEPDQHIRCSTDAVWGFLVSRLRAVLPRPFLLTAAVWSVGAYGEGAFKEAEPSAATPVS